MNELISPKYQMKLVKEVSDAIWATYSSYKDVRFYIKKWHKAEENYSDYSENFAMAYKENKEIDLMQTLHNMHGNDLLKVAIDLGVDTPDFIPSIPEFKNALKSDYKTAYDTFMNAFKHVESDPSLAIGLANSALESIIKEILKDERIQSKVTGKETLYVLTSVILKDFCLTGDDFPKEIRTIGSQLMSISQSIEKLRSEKTVFHGKTDGEYLIEDAVYTYFILNSVTTVGLFLNTFYKTKYPKRLEVPLDDDLPF